MSESYWNEERGLLVQNEERELATGTRYWNVKCGVTSRAIILLLYMSPFMLLINNSRVAGTEKVTSAQAVVRITKWSNFLCRYTEGCKN